MERADSKGRWKFSGGIAKAEGFAEALIAAAKSKKGRSGDYFVIVNDVPFGKSRTLTWDHFISGSHYILSEPPRLALEDWKANNPNG
jgi:hypothetical protein